MWTTVWILVSVWTSHQSNSVTDHTIAVSTEWCDSHTILSTVHPVLFGPWMNCNTIPLIMFLHCSFVLTYSLLQRSLTFSNVDTFTFSTWYLVHDCFLLLFWLGFFVCTRASLRVPFDLKVVLVPRFLHFCSRCSSFLGSKSSYFIFRGVSTKHKVFLEQV